LDDVGGTGGERQRTTNANANGEGDGANEEARLRRTTVPRRRDITSISSPAVSVISVIVE
jgi:hypothetical protein